VTDAKYGDEQINSAPLTRVLLVHNHYGSSAPSGENRVFETESALLRQRGHDVREFVRSSDGIRSNGAYGLVTGGLATPWNPFAARALRREIREFGPDVVHVHNTFPLLSPSCFRAIGTLAASVLTLHNYRLFCSKGTPFRGGNVCMKCVDDRSAWSAIRHACYRDSRLATLPLAVSVELHRHLGTWTEHVDAFIALSEFQRQRMIDGGLPSGHVHVKTNFYPGSPAVSPWRGRGRYVVFVGRLTAEKGVEVLLRAWRLWGDAAPELRIVGDGGLRPELERLAGDLPVRFLGQVDLAEAQRQIAQARLLVLPSECFEGSPMAVIEAFAFGTPVAASDLGPLPFIVRHGVNGVVFQPRNHESVYREIRRVWDAPDTLEELGRGARTSFEAHYAENANYRMLMDVYDTATSVSKRR
jgi:glycosyltransferase involved in cell wall biosynthesis